MKIVSREEFMGMPAGTIFVPVFPLDPRRPETIDFPMVLTEVLENGTLVKGDREKEKLELGVFVTDITKYVIAWARLDDPNTTGHCDYSDYEYFSHDRAGWLLYRIGRPLELVRQNFNGKSRVESFAIFTTGEEAHDYIAQLRFATNLLDLAKEYSPP